MDYREEFGNDNDYVLIGLINRDGVFEESFLNRVDSLTERLSQLPQIDRVESPTRMKRVQWSILNGRPVELPYLHIDAPARYASDSVRIFGSTDYIKAFFGTGEPSILLQLHHKDDLDEDACADLVHQINDQVAALEFDASHAAGKCFGQTLYIELVERETQLFTAASVVVIVLILFFAYRTFWGIWMPLSVVGLTVLWTMAFMVLTGKTIDLMSNIIPTILLVIGISNVVHLLTHYLIRRTEQPDRKKALFSTVKEVGVATVLTTSTTAVGFLTLSTSTFIPLADLGLYATLGIVTALFLTYTLLPSLILLLPPLKRHQSWKQQAFIDHYLGEAFEWIVKHPKSILVASIILTILFGLGCMQIKVNNYVLEDLREGHPQRAAFQFLEDNFAGARSFEMAVQLKDPNKQIYELSVLQQLEKLDGYLEKEYGLGQHVSPVKLVKQANQIYHRGDTNFYKLPANPEVLDYLVDKLEENIDASPVGMLLSNDERIARISGMMADLGSYVVRGKNRALDRFIAENFDSSQLEFELTGTPHLMDLNTSNLAENVLVGLVIAFAIIAIIVAFLLKSIRMVWIALVPNFLPLILIGGIMGFTGIDLKVSTSIIFVIAFGIAVDDSIHFLTRFRHEINKEADVFKAVKNAYATSGKAILITSLILMGGFLCLCLSSFLGTFYVGLLVSATLLFALLADLILLPILILRFYRNR